MIDRQNIGIEHLACSAFQRPHAPIRKDVERESAETGCGKLIHHRRNGDDPLLAYSETVRIGKRQGKQVVRRRYLYAVRLDISIVVVRLFILYGDSDILIHGYFALPDGVPTA